MLRNNKKQTKVRTTPISLNTPTKQSYSLTRRQSLHSTTTRRNTTTKVTKSTKSPKTTKTAGKRAKAITAEVLDPIFSIDRHLDPSLSIFEWVVQQHGSSGESLVGTNTSPFLSPLWLQAQLHPITPSSQSSTSPLSSSSSSSSKKSPPITTSTDENSDSAPIYDIHPNLRIINASWQILHDTSTLSLYQSFLSTRIPSAQHFDMEAASLSESHKPLAFSSPESYSAAISQLGVDQTSSVILYDYNGLLGAAYAHWILSLIGIKPSHIRILSGGWQSWKTNVNNPIESGPPITPPPSTNFIADHDLQHQLHVLDNEMFDLGYAHHITLSNGFIDSRLPIIIDTRSSLRFTGSMREPLSSLSVVGGHIPGSINVPYTTLVKVADSATGIVLKSQQELEEVFAQHIDLPSDKDTPFIVTSGTGTTAAVARLALLSMGYNNIRLYTSGWLVYGNKVTYPKNHRPIEVGPSKYSELSKGSNQFEEHTE